MGIKFKPLGGLLVLLAAGIAFPSVAVAQTETSNDKTLSEVFERTFFKNDRTFYGNRTFRRQIDSLLGPGSLFQNSFPDNEIARDAESVNNLYRDALKDQVTNDPYIRTPDLPNPYDTSLMMSPRFNSTKLRTGTEFRFENVPPR